jgi:hypothetical protein
MLSRGGENRTTRNCTPVRATQYRCDWGHTDASCSLDSAKEGYERGALCEETRARSEGEQSVCVYPIPFGSDQCVCVFVCVGVCAI